MTTATRISRSSLAASLLTLTAAPFAAHADSGFYIGGSAGGATLEAELGDIGIPGLPSDIDEDDTAFKVYAGYTFDLPLLNLGIEAGYVDFGEPDIDVGGEELVIDTTGINLWGIAAFEAGPVDIFGKLGYISWDLDGEFQNLKFSDDGSDIGYGLGLAFNVGPVQVRGEYELYDADDGDIAMASVGIVYQFDWSGSAFAFGSLGGHGIDVVE